MSTTFGVSIEPDSINDEDMVEVARRVGIGSGKAHLSFVNDLAHLLPDDTKVEPLDNSAQGIYTIGDIKSAIKEQEDDR